MSWGDAGTTIRGTGSESSLRIGGGIYIAIRASKVFEFKRLTLRSGNKEIAMKLDIGTLSGVMGAQKKIEKILPVSGERAGLLQKLQARLKVLTRDEVMELMQGLTTLESNCKVLGMAELDIVRE